MLRVSGSDAFAVIRRLTTDHREDLQPRQQVLRRLVHPRTGQPLDQALVTHFPAPRSYTGEDVVEIATHGGLLTPQLVLDGLFAAGARPALPGEFTRRALLNGKLDLLQAEAINDLIDGRSPAMHRAALHQVERGLSRRIEELREMILRVEALVAYSIDFPEEDEPPVPPERITVAASEAIAQVERLLETVPQGEMLRAGALVVFAGRPNSGKSSLFNALLGLERSIVTEVPGTTRDAVEADAVLGGFPFRLVDTAGIRETDDRVEAIGVEVAHRYVSAADILLFCVESQDDVDREAIERLAGRTRGTTIIVRTKSDLLTAGTSSAGEELYASIVTGEGVGALRDGIVAAAFGEVRLEDDLAPIVTSERQKEALRAARSEMRHFLDAMATDLPMAIAAVHLRAAAASLEDLIGIVAPDDVLGAVFSRFCVGK